ncbi:MAG: hypothetical protein LQ351_004955 [Letrouitia transgressa]|nr:MAG: hypothetical protein LQ351_004955 [Letrouitia transgressa]
MKLLTACLLVGLTFFDSGSAGPLTISKRQAPTPPQTPDPAYFSTLAASSSLKWSSCYTDYQCARLEVPLNYQKPKGRKVKLAIVKLPAKKTAKYQGSLFLQVGLGTPSTNLVLAAGGLFQTPTLEGWDIIGWDVRGVGFTTPLLKCFPDEAARQAFEDNAPKVLGDPTIPLYQNIQENYDRYKVLAKACKKRSGDFLPYIDTPNNARDLKTIIKAIGGRGKFAFWGYQYASLLGETLAGLYPNVLDNLILDGVVQGEKAYKFGDNGPSAIQDAEKAFNVFFTSCANANNATCAFHEATPELIRARFRKVEKALLAKPVPVPGLGEFNYGFLHGIISFAVTNPKDLFPFLANVLAEAESGVAGPNIYGVLGTPLEPLPSTGVSGSFEYNTAIQALDADPYRIRSPKDFAPYLKSILRTSPNIGGVSAAATQLQRAAWEVPAAVNFNGDGFFNVRTRATVLFVGNTADPYTPLQNAKSMSRKFRNSRVLTVNAVGFTSLQYTSECRVKVVAAYLNNNVLPARDAVCQQDDPPFGVPLGNL